MYRIVLIKANVQDNTITLHFPSLRFFYILVAKLLIFKYFSRKAVTQRNKV